MATIKLNQLPIFITGYSEHATLFTRRDPGKPPYVQTVARFRLTRRRNKDQKSSSPCPHDDINEVKYIYLQEGEKYGVWHEMGYGARCEVGYGKG